MTQPTEPEHSEPLRNSGHGWLSHELSIALSMIEIASEEAIRHGACESALCISTRSIVRSCKGGADVLLRNRVCVANEGKLIAIVSADLAHAPVARMKQNKYGAGASIIGEVKAEPAGTVSMRTAFGGTRIVNMLVGEQLPRIC